VGAVVAAHSTAEVLQRHGEHDAAAMTVALEADVAVAVAAGGQLTAAQGQRLVERFRSSLASITYLDL
jgi:hypothetical protein